MLDHYYSLAIETSSREGSVAIGCDDRLLDQISLPLPNRHRVELMPTIEQLCSKHKVRPADLGEIAINVGPGSFTGLRIAITTAKMLAMTLGVKIVTAGAVEVVAAGAGARAADAKHLAVCLASRQEAFYCGQFDRSDKGWQLCGEAKVMTADQLLAIAPRPLAITGEGQLQMQPADDIILFEAPKPQAGDLWRITRGRASCDPLGLSPIYAHPPQAQSQWDDRYGKDATIQNRVEGTKGTGG